MAKVETADYGFIKHASGNELRLEITKSRAAQSAAKVRRVLGYFLLFILCMAPGGCAGGNANSFTMGFFWTVVYFVVALFALKFLKRVLRATSSTPDIVLTPTTITAFSKTYNLSDVRNWSIGNTRLETSQSVRAGTAALANDMMIGTSYYVSFDYGNEVVKAAWNLSEPQAHALAQEITSFIEKRDSR